MASSTLVGVIYSMVLFLFTGGKDLSTGTQTTPILSATAKGRSQQTGQVAGGDKSVFENSIGMRFASVPLTSTLFSVWETRVADYGKFAATSNVHKSWQTNYTVLEPNHPVLYVDWKDATNFCGWLTELERANGSIGVERYYRLPTDLEWSYACGLTNESGQTPVERSSSELVFEWGNKWPPPNRSGNFADSAFRKDAVEHRFKVIRFIPRYTDGYYYTAPVGSFPPNIYGIYDLSGNVQEWCDDSTNKGVSRVVRGGYWGSDQKEDITLRARNCPGGYFRTSSIGFRVVLAKYGDEKR